MHNPLFRRAIIILLAGLVLLGGALAGALWLRQSPDHRDGMMGEAAIGGSFELVDQNGEPFTDQDLEGHYSLVFFGYTYCPDFCPQTLLTVTEALDQLAEEEPEKADAVVPVFITVDPERDTVEAMNAYAQHFHESLVALTGSEEQIAETARAYRVFYRKVEEDSYNDYLMDHSTFVFLMGPDGKYVTHFTHGTAPEEIAAALDERVAG